MSPKLHYQIVITDIFTQETKTYEVTGPVNRVVDVINSHYGCSFISHAGICNVITRPHVIAERFKGLSIKRFQCPTRTYPHAVGSKHQSLPCAYNGQSLPCVD